MNLKNKFFAIAAGVIFASILAVGSFILGVYYIQQQQSSTNKQDEDNLQIKYTYNVTPSTQPVSTTVTPTTCSTVNPTNQPVPKYKTFVDKTLGIKFTYPASYGLKVSRRDANYKPNSTDYRDVNWLGQVALDPLPSNRWNPNAMIKVYKDVKHFQIAAMADNFYYDIKSRHFVYKGDGTPSYGERILTIGYTNAGFPIYRVRMNIFGTKDYYVIPNFNKDRVVVVTVPVSTLTKFCSPDPLGYGSSPTPTPRPDCVAYRNEVIKKYSGGQKPGASGLPVLYLMELYKDMPAVIRSIDFVK